MRLAILTCVWGRPDLSIPVLEHTARLRVPGAELVPVCVWSPEDTDASRLRCVPDWHFVAAPNNPVSDKWNAGARALRHMNVDAMCIIGSDDFVNEAFIMSIVERLRQGAHYVMPQSLYFYDTRTREAIYAYARRVGAGRTITRRVLDELNWRPWKSGFDRGIDGAMDKRIAMMSDPLECEHVTDIRAEGGMLLAVKTEENLWTFQKMKQGLEHEELDAPALLREHFPKHARMLLQWNR